MLDLHSGGKKGTKEGIFLWRGWCVQGSVSSPSSQRITATLCCLQVVHLSTTCKFISGKKAELSASQSLILMTKDCGDDHLHVHACTQSHYFGTTVCCPP